MPDAENLRVEYSATNDAYMHYDGFRWQAGSFLVTGVFVFWGLLVQQTLPPSVIVTASFLIAGLMTTWLLFAHHYRQIYMGKLRRLWQLEVLLGAEQHTRFRRDLHANPYPTFGPRGHNLDVAVFFITSVGGVGLGIARNGFEWVYLLPLPFVAVVIRYILRQERIHRAALSALDA